LIAYFFIYLFQVSNHSLQLLIVLITTLIISASFYIYFIMMPLGTSFFSRWFNKVGFRAVFFDMILLFLIFMIMNQFYMLIT
jgi:hypothetical protein